MEKVYRISENSLKNIADAIRFKNGTTTEYNIAEMPEAIKSIALITDGSTDYMLTGQYQGTDLIISENAFIDLREYLEKHEVPLDIQINVPIPEGYIVPEGTLEITENGTHNVNAYESANVNVPIPEGYIIPEGTLEITENGEKDITNYASVNVNVELHTGEPQEVATADEMDALLVAENVGKVYLYTGETTDVYTNGKMYVIEEV